MKLIAGNRLRLLTALMVAEILSAFELSMLYAALRFLIEDFGDPVAVGWIITSFLLASAVAAAICGRLGDMFGRQRVLLAVIAVSIVGSLISGFSSTLGGVIAGRVIQGAAGAIFPLCLGLIRENTSAAETPIFVGVLAATMTVSGGFGAVLGGVLVDNLSWHWIFFAGAAVGVGAMLLVYCWVPANPGSGGVRGTNVLGGILFAPAVACLLLVTTESASWGWASLLTLGFLAAGLILLLAWMVSELRSRAPLINVRLLAKREVLLVNLGGAVLGLSAFQFIQLWSILLQQPSATGVGLGLSATLAGWIMLPMTLMALVGGPAAGWLIQRYGGRLTIMGGAFTLALTWALATLYNDSVPWILTIMVVMGLGQAVYYSGIIILLTQAVPMERTSEATGMMVVIRLTTLGIGAQLVANLLDSSTVSLPGGRGSFPDAGAYLLAMSYITAGCVVMLVIAALLPGKKLSDERLASQSA